MAKKKKNDKKSAIQKASEKIFGKWSKWWEDEAPPEVADGGYETVTVGDGGTSEEYAQYGGAYTREVDYIGEGKPSGSTYGSGYSTYRPRSYQESYSSRWQDKIYGSGWVGNWNNNWYKGEKDRAKLYQWGAQLARTANITLHPALQEQPLYLCWTAEADVKVNSPTATSIYISPDKLLSAKDEEVGMVMDAMIGKVLLLSTLKSTMSKQVWKDNYGRTSTGAGQVWLALELAAAKADLMVNWGGFMPYLVRHADLTCSDKKEALEADMKMNLASVECALRVLSWNIANPENEITIPAIWEEPFAEAEELIGEGVVSAEFRYNVASRITEAFNRKFVDKGGFQGDSALDMELFGDQVISSASNGSVPGAIDMTKFNGNGVELPEGVMPLSGEPYVEFHDGGHIPDVNGQYKALVKEMDGAIKALRGALKFRNNAELTGLSFCHRSGDLDTGALHKFALNEEDPAVWERKNIRQQPQLVVGLLIDESGSMMDSRKIWHARNVAVAMIEALRVMPSIDVVAMGHSANCVSRPYGRLKHKGVVMATGKERQYERSHYAPFRFAEYYTKDHTHPYGIMSIEAQGNNLDGFAMEMAARKLAKDYPAAVKRLLFVVSDGQPSGRVQDGSAYGGESAAHHMRAVCSFSATKLRVEVYGIGISDAYGHEEGVAMYGDGRFCILHDVMTSIPVLTSFISQVAKKL